MKRRTQGQTAPAVATIIRDLRRYDGREFLGSFKITERHRHGKRTLRTIAAKDARGVNLGIFKTQKAAVASIDRAASTAPIARPKGRPE